ncbi:hypothetical protein FB45DRAFT_1007510 [Roridomyces roridus]|uniref:BHLH domain-containing protein n=1 Tax=Roridomyces roridus TaxID=1738132 RepID=A0AAD7BDP5_9AGAR|nr:hypothetical protein FB45DRAFT_1007510 [Roridomyces roridus]
MPGSTDDESSDPQQHAESSQTGGGPRKRVRLFTPAERATHRVVEKQRREALNNQFIELARLLPGLAKTRRLSKSVIVNESIAHQRKQRAERLACARQLRAMRTEQASLVAEVNALREKLGITERRESPVGVDAAEDPEEEREEGPLTVDGESFGAFPAALVEEDEEDARGVALDSAHAKRGRSGKRALSSGCSKTSESDSPSRNASGRESSASPARVSSWINGVVQAAALPHATPPGPLPSFLPSTVPYDADFLAMFSNPSLNPTDPAFPAFYTTSPAPPAIRHPDAFSVNQLPFVQPLPETYNFPAHPYPPPHVYYPPVYTLPADLFSVNFGVLEDYPPIPQATAYSLSYPPVPIHLGTHGGFPSV